MNSDRKRKKHSQCGKATLSFMSEDMIESLRNSNNWKVFSCIFSYKSCNKSAFSCWKLWENIDSIFEKKKSSLQITIRITLLPAKMTWGYIHSLSVSYEPEKTDFNELMKTLSNSSFNHHAIWMLNLHFYFYTISICY